MDGEKERRLILSPESRLGEIAIRKRIWIGEDWGEGG
jgi:hypothetical protein